MWNAIRSLPLRIGARDEEITKIHVSNMRREPATFWSRKRLKETLSWMMTFWTSAHEKPNFLRNRSPTRFIDSMCFRDFTVAGALQVLRREATRARGAAGPQHEDAVRGCGSFLTCSQTHVFFSKHDENIDPMPISNSCSQRAWKPTSLQRCGLWGFNLTQQQMK